MKRTSKDNKIELVKNGKNFIDVNNELINQAKEFIFLHAYIFEDDIITEPIIQSLIDASKRGVHVFVLIDSYGSRNFSKDTHDKLTYANVHFIFFRPFNIFNNWARRLHQKVLLVDNRKAIIGGINYSQSFNNPKNSKPWLDYSCLIEGAEVYNIFQKVIGLYLKNFKTHKDLLNTFKKFSHTIDCHTLIRTNVNDWTRYDQEIYKSYLNAIKVSQTEIIILATYFVPGKQLLKYLKKASKRGVKIKLIFGAMSDHPIVSTAANYFYEWYLKNGIEIYEWDQSIIHGKLALIDEKWVTIGSYNHNYLSRYSNLEINIEVLNKDFSKKIKSEFKNIISQSKQIKESNLPKTVKNRIKVVAVYLLTNIIIFLSLFLIIKRNKKDKTNVLN